MKNTKLYAWLKLVLLLSFFPLTAVVGQPLSGPNLVCVSENATYSATPGPSCLGDFVWTIVPPIGSFLSGNTSSDVNISWSAPGVTQLCFTDNSCALPPTCITVTVGEPSQSTEFHYLCPGGCVTCGGQDFCAPGTYQVTLTNWLGCDSNITCVVIPVPPLSTNLGVITLGCNDSYSVCGQDYSLAGTYSAVCQSWQGCDSTVNFQIETISTVTADAGPDQVLDCTTTQLTLTGFGPTGPEYAYQWTTTGGGIVSNANTLTPIINAPGVYCLEVVNIANGCTATDCMSVVENINLPTFSLGPDLTMPCAGEMTLQFGGIGSPGLGYQWVTANGIITSGETTLTPIVNQAGTYCLTITNLASGCTTSDCIEITANPDAPAVDAGPDIELSCSDIATLQPTVTISPTYQYFWNGPGGYSNPNLNHNVSIEGTYCLVGTNLVSGCTTTDCLTLTRLSSTPVFSVFPAAMLCNGDNPMLYVDNLFGTSDSAWVYNWSTADGNIVTGQDSMSVEVSQPGLYCVTVTDTITGCSKSLCKDVFPNGKILVNPDKAVCFGQNASIAFTLVPNTYSVMWRYVQVGDDPPLVITQLTDYNYSFQYAFTGPTTVKIWAEKPFDPSCISDTAYVNVHAIDFDFDFELEQSGCQPANITAIDPQGFSFSWGNGQVGSSVFTSTEGWNYVTITASGGCSGVDSVFVSLDYAGNCATIQGNIQKDLPENCLPDANNPGLKNFLVRAVGPETFYATTDATGHYVLPVEPGDYTVTVMPTSVFWEPCGNDFPVSLSDPDDSANVDFLIKKLPGCPELSVDITSAFLRRCNTGNYHLNYCNQGVEPATDAYIVVDLDDDLEFFTATLPFADLGNNQYRFDIGTVEPGDCGSFWITVNVSCDAVLGQTHCTEAHIYPDSSCVAPNPLWSGASLRVEAECDADSVHFTVSNIGTNAMSGPLDFVVIEDAVMYLQVPSPGPVLEASESFELTVPANGATWRMVVEQEPYHPASAAPTVAVEGCGANFSTGFINQFPLGDDPLFLDIDCTQNVGSFDPNDKQGFPIGYGDEHQVLPGTELQYLIRFQNTGTDTAFNVIIRDTLSSLLDVASVRPGASSHPYEFEIYGQGVLKFTFPNILLPDSSANQVGSNGFVQFTAKPRADLPLGSIIENTAAIYFDLNEPVLTNTVFHTIDSNFIEVNQVKYRVPNIALHVSPNPFDESLRVQIAGLPIGKPLTFSLLDATGRQVGQQQFFAPSLVFAAQKLPSGFYFFKIEEEGQVIAAGKVVRR